MQQTANGTRTGTSWKSAGALLMAGALGGCGWVATGTNQPIHVATPDAAGAVCEFRSPRGAWTVVTPGPVLVPKTRYKLTATCRKEGFRPVTVEISPGFEPWAIGNIFMGGVIGFSVDWSTGALHEYPDRYTIHMEPEA